MRQSVTPLCSSSVRASAHQCCIAGSCTCREDGKPDGPPQSTEDLIKESLTNPAAKKKPTDTKLTPQQLEEVRALQLLPSQGALAVQCQWREALPAYGCLQLLSALYSCCALALLVAITHIEQRPQCQGTSASTQPHRLIHLCSVLIYSSCRCSTGSQATSAPAWLRCVPTWALLPLTSPSTRHSTDPSLRLSTEGTLSA